jgi:hypothetical protein
MSASIPRIRGGRSYAVLLATDGGLVLFVPAAPGQASPSARAIPSRLPRRR